MKRIVQPFYKMSLWLLDRIPEGFWKGKKRVAEERLRVLYPGKKPDVKSYYAGRIAGVFAALFWGMGLVFLTECAVGGKKSAISDMRLSRPSYGEGERETELEAFLEGETEGIRVPVQIQEQRYTAEEIQKIFSVLTGELEEQISGENESLKEVRSDLFLPSAMQNGAVSITWNIQPSDLIDTQGKLLREPAEEGELAELRAVLEYGELEAEYTCYAQVYPPVRTERERVAKHLEREVEEADDMGKYTDTLALPGEIDGRKVSWSGQEEPIGAPLMLLAFTAAALVWMSGEKKLEKKERERRRQLILDYPELLFQMAMLLGAGLTLKSTFVKIASDYQKQRRKQPRYVYEEMLFACREMENGVGEAWAYENFGRRCGEAEYIKLGAVLSRNLKKGTQGLLEFLEGEAQAGLEQRRNTARRLGEEAGTKLLLPMMLMLVLTLAILVIPAVASF